VQSVSPNTPVILRIKELPTIDLSSTEGKRSTKAILLGEESKTHLVIHAAKVRSSAGAESLLIFANLAMGDAEIRMLGKGNELDETGASVDAFVEATTGKTLAVPESQVRLLSAHCSR
jgi:hypothetical protein